jgi:hypothetical protein
MNIDLRSFLVLGALLLAPGCESPSASTSPAPDPAAPRPIDHGQLDAVQRACVRDGGVDYLLLRRDYLFELDRYLKSLADLDPARVTALSDDERLALYLNAYNATVMREVARRIRVGFRVSENDFAMFREPLVTIAGAVMSLDHLEHEVLRKQFAAPNVHAALVCASKSCPPISDSAFAAFDVAATLDDRMRGFLRDPTRNVVDENGGAVKLSPIFSWYAKDFGGERGVAEHAAKYLGDDLQGATIEYGEYDWSLNLAPLESGHPWRAILADREITIVDGSTRGLRCGDIVEELAPDAAHGDLARVRLGDGTVGHLPRDAFEIFDPTRN